MSTQDATLHFADKLTDYEKQEIGKFDKHIYYLGQNCKKKIKGHIIHKTGKPPEFVSRLKERLR